MPIKPMSEDEKNQELSKLFGGEEWRRQDSFGEADAETPVTAKDEDDETPDFLEPEEDEEEQGEGAPNEGRERAPEKTGGARSLDEQPKTQGEDYSWAETVRAENAQLQAYLHDITRQNQELSARIEAARQPSQPQPEPDTTDYGFLTTDQWEQQRKSISAAFAQQQRFLHDIALGQEREMFTQTVNALKAENPGFAQVWTDEKLASAWGAFSQQAHRLGFRQPWRESFLAVYKQSDYGRLQEENARLKREIEAGKQKKNTERRQRQADLAKIAPGGSAFREQSNVLKFGKPRDVSDPDVRAEVLKLMQAGE